MPPLPAIPGAELAGVVDQVGPGVTQWAVGDRVLVSARDLSQRGGCYVQAIVVPESAPYRLPDAIAVTDAVSLPNLQLAQALLLGLNGGRADARSVLITGASGGVATMLAQLARHHGMLTLGTARTTDKRAFAMANGFDAVLDPSAPDLPQRVKDLTGGTGVDLALDPIGGQTLIDCIHSLAPLGRWCPTTSSPARLPRMCSPRCAACWVAASRCAASPCTPSTKTRSAGAR